VDGRKQGVLRPTPGPLASVRARGTLEVASTTWRQCPDRRGKSPGWAKSDLRLGSCVTVLMGEVGGRLGTDPTH